MVNIPVVKTIPVYGGPNDGAWVTVPLGATPTQILRHEAPPGYVFRYRLTVQPWGQCFIPDGEPYSAALEAWPVDNGPSSMADPEL